MLYFPILLPSILDLILNGYDAI